MDSRGKKANFGRDTGPPGIFNLKLRHGGRIRQSLPAKYLGGSVSSFNDMVEDEWGLICLKEKVLEIWIVKGGVGDDADECDGSKEKSDGSGSEWLEEENQVAGQKEKKKIKLQVAVEPQPDVITQVTQPEVEENQWEIQVLDDQWHQILIQADNVTIVEAARCSSLSRAASAAEREGEGGAIERSKASTLSTFSAAFAIERSKAETICTHIKAT
nr:uncharacterized protein LOC109184816 [Ipomoea batatas]